MIGPHFADEVSERVTAQALDRLESYFSRHGWRDYEEGFSPHADLASLSAEGAHQTLETIRELSEALEAAVNYAEPGRGHLWLNKAASALRKARGEA